MARKVIKDAKNRRWRLGRDVWKYRACHFNVPKLRYEFLHVPFYRAKTSSQTWRENSATGHKSSITSLVRQHEHISPVGCTPILLAFASLVCSLALRGHRLLSRGTSPAHPRLVSSPSLPSAAPPRVYLHHLIRLRLQKQKRIQINVFLLFIG